jgi:hypothetical protein
MENKVSEKIRLILNELAILNQPEQKENKIFYRLEDLIKIRSLAAELYLNGDMAVQTGEVYQTSIPVFETQSDEVSVHVDEAEEIVEPEITAPEVTQPEEEIISTPIFEEPLKEETLPELQAEPPAEPVLAEEEIVEIPTATEPVIAEVAEEEPIQTELPLDAQIDTHEPSEQLQEQHDFKPPRITSEQIASQISFTRRFEYINQLFGGNTELFMEFLDEMGYSRDTVHAMEIFDKHYYEKNWQRKQESAAEFKRLLQRSC